MCFIPNTNPDLVVIVGDGEIVPILYWWEIRQVRRPVHLAALGHEFSDFFDSHVAVLDRATGKVFTSWGDIYDSLDIYLEAGR